VDEGLQVAAGFFALGLLWLFISQWLLLIVNWLRQLIG